MPKQRPNQPEGAMKHYAIGRTAQMVRRVKYNGIVSSDATKNTFIKVGKTTPVAIVALHQVFGKGFCPATLCSNKLDTWRMQCGDKSNHSDHKQLDKKTHDLPPTSGPNCQTWQSVVDQSNELRKKLSAKKQKNKKKSARRSLEFSAASGFGLSGSFGSLWVR